MEEVGKLLQEIFLPQYVDRFREAGYDCLQHLLSMQARDLQQLARVTNMSAGHIHRLAAALGRARTAAGLDSHAVPLMEAAVAPNAPPVPLVEAAVVPLIQSPAVPYIAHVQNPGPNMPSTKEFVLQDKYSTAQDVRLASLKISTLQTCSAVTDQNNCGGKCRTYVCRSVKSKRKLKEMAEVEDEGAPTEEDDGAQPQCPHKLVWRRRQSGVWHLLRAKSHIGHMPYCASGQHVTRFELAADRKFITNMNVAKKVQVTGKRAAAQAIGSGGRIAGSVTDYTARRARKDIIHASDKYYADDWHKMQAWGRELTKMNRETRFDLFKDPNNGRYELVLGLSS